MMVNLIPLVVHLLLVRDIYVKWEDRYDVLFVVVVAGVFNVILVLFDVFGSVVFGSVVAGSVVV